MLLLFVTNNFLVTFALNKQASKFTAVIQHLYIMCKLTLVAKVVRLI